MTVVGPGAFLEIYSKIKKNEHTVIQIISGDNCITKPQLTADALVDHFQHTFSPFDIIPSIPENTPLQTS
jgi:hypothetical protein